MMRHARVWTLVLIAAAALVAGAEPLNVVDFGAKADGRTDCTEAFQKAIDALGARGGRVDVPADNQLYRSGKPEWAHPERPYSAHAVLRNCSGVTFSSNSLVLGRDDDGKGVWSPKTGLVLENLTECTVVGNSGSASVTEKFIDDRGGHRDSVIRDNAGSALKSLDQVTIPLPDHE